MIHSSANDLFYLSIECVLNEDCSGASDTCTDSVCYCGSMRKCTGGTDSCTAGKCKCGDNDHCSFSEICSFGRCSK